LFVGDQNFDNATKVKIELNEMIYILWHQQVFATIRGMKLLKYKGDQIPKKYLTKDHEKNDEVNDDFLNYEQQDQLLVAWLLA